MRKLLILIFFALTITIQGQVLSSVVASTASSSTPSTLLNGLVGYWDFDEASGDLADLVGSCDGSNTDITYSASGKIGTSYTYNNSSSTTVISDGSSLLQLGKFTISFWVYSTSSSDRIMGYTNAGTGGWTVTTNSGGLLTFYTRTATAGHVDSNDDLRNGWHHIVATYDQITVLMYVDGTLQTMTDPTTAVPSYTDAIFKIGEYGGTNFFGGSLDEMGVWNRVFGQTSVDSLYNSGTGITYPF